MKNSCKSKKRYILGCDPSGSYKEGNGTTGLALYDRETKSIIQCSSVEAHAYTPWQEYYKAVWKKLWWMARDYPNDIVVVIEDYLLYASKANAQINSILETPRLIGYLLMKLYEHETPACTQRAVDVKNRWSDDILEHHGIITKVGKNKTYEHCHGYSPYIVTVNEYDMPLQSHHLDAIRHAVHYGHFGKE